jgi:DNA primase
MTPKSSTFTSGASLARVVEAHQAAADYYADTLASRHGAGPWQYLVDRGLGPVVTGALTQSDADDAGWVVGYAPPGWTALVGELRGQGFTDAELLAAGLAITTRRGTLVDRFRDRIMFGLHDTASTEPAAAGTRPSEGRLVGFIGRAAPGAAPGVPKYLNTARTVLFDKSRVLLGLVEQQHQLVRGAVPVLVEGPLDVLAVAAAAPRSGRGTAAYVAVSPCGTALTPAHVTTLSDALGGSRIGSVVVAFDGDDAGRRAARTAYSLLADRFGGVRGTRLPDGQDPAELAATDGARLTAALQSAGPLVDDLVDQVLDSYARVLDNAEARVAALREAMRLVAGLPSREVARQVARTATGLGFPVAVASGELVAAATRTPARRLGTGAVVPSLQRPYLSTATDCPRVLPSRAAPSAAGWSRGR